MSRTQEDDFEKSSDDSGRICRRECNDEDDSTSRDAERDEKETGRTGGRTEALSYEDLKPAGAQGSPTASDEGEARRAVVAAGTAPDAAASDPIVGGTPRERVRSESGAAALAETNNDEGEDGRDKREEVVFSEIVGSSARAQARALARRRHLASKCARHNLPNKMEPDGGNDLKTVAKAPRPAAVPEMAVASGPDPNDLIRREPERTDAAPETFPPVEPPFREMEGRYFHAELIRRERERTAAAPETFLPVEPPFREMEGRYFHATESSPGGCRGPTAFSRRSAFPSDSSRLSPTPSAAGVGDRAGSREHPSAGAREEEASSSNIEGSGDGVGVGDASTIFSAVLAPDSSEAAGGRRAERPSADAEARRIQRIRDRIMSRARAGPLVEDAVIVTTTSSSEREDIAAEVGTIASCRRWAERNPRIAAIPAVFLIVVAVAVPVVLALVLSDRRVPPPPPSRRDAILSVLEKVTGREVLEDPSSPQHRALVWLADEDERRVDARDVVALTQRFAVATLFFSTGGNETWTTGLGFLSPEHECSWYESDEDGGYWTSYWEHRVFWPNKWKGVVCNETTLLINLPHHNLTGSLPNELGLLSNTIFILLNHNSLGCTLPSTIGHLSKLQSFFVWENHFTGVLPPSLGNLSHLQSLQIYFNELTGPIPESFGRLSNLRDLILGLNDLSGSIPPSVNQMSQLENLDLISNSLNGTIPLASDGLPNLKVVNLYGNQLTGAIPSSINNLKNLESFGASSNALTGTLPFTAGSLPNLKRLSLFYNHISGSVPMSIFTYRNLTSVDLAPNPLTGTLPQEVGEARNLEMLTVGESMLTGTLPSSIARLERLNWLLLIGTLINGTIPSAIGNLSSLEILTLLGNGFTGTLPATVGDLTKLRQLHVAFNSLTGTLPDRLGDLEAMTNLYLWLNSFTGTVPQSLARMHSLYELDISRNSFNGSINFLCGRNNSIKILTADCAEVSCDCCTLCCTDGDASGPTVLGCHTK